MTCKLVRKNEKKERESERIRVYEKRKWSDFLKAINQFGYVIPGVSDGVSSE